MEGGTDVPAVYCTIPLRIAKITRPAAGYAVGIGTAYLRMYHNKHWLGDVVAGAGIGIVSTRFSYYLYPILKNWIFGSKKVREGAMIMPSYQAGGIYGLNIVYGF